MTSRPDFQAPFWFALGPYRERFEQAVEELQAEDAATRVWARDGSLWNGAAKVIMDIEDRLGWLLLPRQMRLEVTRLKAISREVQFAGIHDIVLIGMGGSCLAPEVMRLVLGVAPEHPELTVLDSTDPAQIRHVAEKLSLPHALFLVVSKSGNTAEVMALYQYFRAALAQEVGEEWARHMVAITDPGTSLENLARENGFRNLYLNPPDIGGRYSALSLFGLVPAALIGADLDLLLERAGAMARQCRATVAYERNPGLLLGAIMGALATDPESPRDRLTLITSPRLSSFAAWVEQLVAESTGKAGVGILPVEGEALEDGRSYGDDRLFAYVRLSGDDNGLPDDTVRALVEAGHPVAVMRLDDVYDLGAEFFRWEFATAVAGKCLGINPFDQPNVESAKEQAREALAAFEETRSLPQLEPVLREGPLTVYGPNEGVDGGLAAYLSLFLGQARPGDYVALMAYVARNSAHNALLQRMRRAIGERLGLAVTVGFGPRFLHSTGQLHKGGPDTGIFLQITQDEADDLPIPAADYTFGVLKEAQAVGDLRALEAEGRRVVRVGVGSDVASGLRLLSDVLDRALSR